MKRFTIAALVAAVALAVTMPSALAQTAGYGPGMMGGGMGPGMGMGLGMMGGYGMGAGMMDGCGMVPGMMGGHGMGPGMMGGAGMMRGYHGNSEGPLNLTDDQRERITKIHESLAMKHWELMGNMQEQRFMFRDMLASGKADDAAIGRAFKRMEELRQQMQVSGADAQKQVDAVLTKEQRDQLQRGGSRTN